MEQQPCWEYCRLCIQDSYHNVHNNIYSFDVQIWFIDSRGDVVERQIASMEQSFTFDPWLKAIGLLGGSSWKLVTVKIGVITEPRKSLLLENQVAYFKRPEIPGRPIDDVELNFAMSGQMLPLDNESE